MNPGDLVRCRINPSAEALTTFIDLGAPDFSLDPKKIFVVEYAMNGNIKLRGRDLLYATQRFEKVEMFRRRVGKHAPLKDRAELARDFHAGKLNVGYGYPALVSKVDRAGKAEEVAYEKIRIPIAARIMMPVWATHALWVNR